MLLQGDDKVRLAPPGKDWPTEFVSKPGSVIIVQIWKKAEK